MGARDALAWVLRSLDGPDTAVSATAAECAAQLRTAASDRRLLLWLEDATDLATVRHLLPASPGCAVLITSRLPLTGLEQASELAVPPLTSSDSRTLLESLMGRPAEPAEEGDLRSVIAHCRGLPLALRIVGARLAAGGPATIGQAARALEEGRRLDWLVAGDLSLRGTLRFALSDAGAAATRLFALLAVIGSRLVPVWVAAALLDTDEGSAEQAAHQLVQLGLLEPAAERCFGVHSLLLSLAEETFDASGVDAADARAAQLRVLRTAVYLASAADERIPHGTSFTAGITVPEVPVAPATVAAVDGDPLHWLDANLPAMVGMSATTAEPALRAALAVRLNGYLTIRDAYDLRLRLLESIDASRLPAGLASRLWQCRFAAHAQHGADAGLLRSLAGQALDAALTAGSDALTATALAQVGYAAHQDCAMAEAEQAYRRALALIDSSGGPARARASVLCGLAGVLDDDERTDLAIDLYGQAAWNPAQAGSRIQAIALVALATALVDLGEDGRAQACLRDATRIIHGMGDELGSAHAAVVNARINGQRSHWPEAERCLAFAEEVGRRHHDADLRHLMLQARGELAFRRGDRRHAERLLAECVRDSSRAGDKLGVRRARRLQRSLGLAATRDADTG